MVHKDLKILSQMLKSYVNLAKWSLSTTCCAITYNIVDEIRRRLGSFTKYSGFEFDDNAQRGSVDAYENILYRRPGTYVWVIKKAAKGAGGDFYTSFQGRVVEDAEGKKSRYYLLHQ
jgi:hypothetical protein